MLAVLGYHLTSLDAQSVIGLALAPVVRLGWAGVDIFFVLSGYLVASIILREATLGEFDGWRFLRRRMLRLWPPLYVSLGVSWLTMPTRDASFILPFVLHAQNFIPGGPQHLWSLAVEEHFYVAAAVLIPLLARRTDPWACACPVLTAVLIAVPLARLMAVWIGTDVEHIYVQTQFRADSLTFGMFVGVASRYRPNLIIRIGSLRRSLLTTALLSFGLAMVMDNPSFSYTLGLVLVDIGATSLLLFALGARTEQPSRLVRMLGWCGVRSYSIYLWHLAIGRTVGAAALLVVPSCGTAAIIVALIAVLAMGQLSFSLLERPTASRRERDPRSGGRVVPAAAR